MYKKDKLSVPFSVGDNDIYSENTNTDVNND